ncbi:MAG: dienelactone hydrolase family protein [Bacteroidota bacterium]
MKSLFTLFVCILPGLMFGQKSYKQLLDDSPRHHEWVAVKNGDRTIHCFVVYPEVSDQATTLLMIHENRGLNDWARVMADQIAAKGYIVIAPDLLSGAGPHGGKTSDFPTTDDARNAIYQLDASIITEDLKAIEDYASKIAASNGKLALAGFCWGGSQTFRHATNSESIAAAFVFYGTGPKEAEAYQRIKAPVYGFYGGNDNRVNSTIEFSKNQMKATNNVYEAAIFDGAGHAFMRRGMSPAGGQANVIAREAAFERLTELLTTL